MLIALLGTSNEMRPSRRETNRLGRDCRIRHLDSLPNTAFLGMCRSRFYLKTIPFYYSPSGGFRVSQDVWMEAVARSTVTKPLALARKFITCNPELTIASSQAVT